MSNAKRYDAVHLRYEENNIRYGEGCEVEVVAAYDYDALAKTHSEVETDRDIKAANLQLLVQRVLMWEVQDSAFQLAPELQAEFNETMALARGLKQ